MAYNKNYTMEYLSKLKEIRFRVKPDEFEAFQKAAERQGYKSMRQFFLAAITEKIERGASES